MKTITIYQRRILERTKYRAFRYKEIMQFTVLVAGKEVSTNHYQKITNPKLKIPFEKTFESRKRNDLIAFASSLTKKYDDQCLSSVIMSLLDGKNPHSFY